MTELERYRKQFEALGLRLSEDGVEIGNYETYLFEAQHQLQRAAEQRQEGAKRYRLAAELVKTARETVGGETTQPDPRPAFGVVGQTIADWRAEKRADDPEYHRRDRKLLEFQHLFAELFGASGHRWPRGERPAV